MISHPNAKINIGLNVLRKREDGYHDIETLFYPVPDMCDCLEIVSGDDYSRTSARLFGKYGSPSSNRDGENAPIRQGISENGKLMITVAREEGVDWNPLKDLCAKAYMALDADFNLPPVKIFIEKLIPVGAGLGGGSADAAFTLKMLAEMFVPELDGTALVRYASELGSDCAFFIMNRPMFGSGRGEMLSECQWSGIDGFDLKVITPEGISVSTVEAYKGIVPKIPGVPLRQVLKMPVGQWKDCLENDFEKTVFPAHPELALIKQSLYDSGATYASMSGSGSALFALYPR